MNKWQELERQKWQWRISNPTATPREFAQACHRIAMELGL